MLNNGSTERASGRASEPATDRPTDQNRQWNTECRGWRPWHRPVSNAVHLPSVCETFFLVSIRRTQETQRRRTIKKLAALEFSGSRAIPVRRFSWLGYAFWKTRTSLARRIAKHSPVDFVSGRNVPRDDGRNATQRDTGLVTNPPYLANYKVLRVRCRFVFSSGSIARCYSRTQQVGRYLIFEELVIRQL